jgi:Bacterial Ig-like domain (group 3)
MRRRSLRIFNAVVVMACLALAVGAGRADAATAAPSVPSASAGTTTSLVLGEPTVDYGQESIEHFSVTVATTGAVAPTGTVTVSSRYAAVCAIKLVPVTAATAGGSCSPAPNVFAPGSYQLTAAYSGDTANAAAASLPATLAVSKGATTTSLSLSLPAAGYAAQQAEQVNVSVLSPDGATPDGSVQVSAGSTPVCTIALTAGAGSCALAAGEFAPGIYQLTASYAGSPDYAASVSEEEALTVSASATTTTLTLSAPTVSYGDEQAVQARIAVSAADAVAPTGTVTLSSGAVALCKVALSVVNGSLCVLPSSVEFAPGSYPLTAEYSGTGGDGTSTSAARTLTVTPAETTTSLALSAPTKAYGTEETERLSVVVSPEYAGTPSGAVTVSTGTKTLCTITLVAASASATGSCVLSAAALAAGTSELTASYKGSVDFAASTAAPAFLAISPSVTTTVLSLSTGTVHYGDEQSERVTVAVNAEYVGPSGTVTVKSGTRPVCVVTVTAGRGNCALPASMFRAGTADLWASFAGNGDFIHSYSASRMLTVARADPAIAVTMSAAKTVYGKEQGERLSVAVIPEHAGTPTGRAIVKSGSVTICQIKLAAGKGGCSLGATQFAVGTAKITVSYGGDGNFDASASKAVTLGIAKAASTTTLRLSAVKVAYGKEQVERVSVVVAARYKGIPTGRVIVRSGAATVCVITLVAGKGSCVLSARSLRIGAHNLVVAYPGCPDFTSSTSARMPLAVIR